MGIFLAVSPSLTIAKTQGILLLAAQKAASANGGTTIAIVAREIPFAPVPPEPASLKMWVTAYSSTPEETDDTPFTTASGKRVRDGVVATNLLPFGTRIMIPSLFGDKVFIVEDRMHRRKKNNIDIWMPSKLEALEFGASYTEIIILKTPSPVISYKL